MEKRIRFTIILVLILIVVIAFSFQSKEKKEYLVYNEALDKTAVTVDDVSLTLKDIAFYVAYEEKTVQEQAILYNPDNPRQYWNVYTDGQFVKLTAKQAALDMAVHDEIFYQMAVAEGMKLDVTEQEYLENEDVYKRQVSTGGFVTNRGKQTFRWYETAFEHCKCTRGEPVIFTDG